MKKNNNNLTATTSNISALTDVLMNDVAILNKHIASNGGKNKVHKILADNKAKLAAVHKSLRNLNELIATEYYKATPAVDVVRIASVPCKTLEFDKVNAVYSIGDGFVHPTVNGMKKFLPEGIIDRLDVLRRCGAYLAMEGMADRESALYGKVVNDKKANVPTEAVKALLPKPEEISKSSVKAMLTRAISELTQGDAVPFINSNILNDFTRFCVDRDNKVWGGRTLADQEHVGDIVLEYSHMLLNGVNGFTVKVVSK